MNVDDLRRLYAYDEWANRLLLDAAEALGTEAWVRPLPSSYPSLRGTFAHIAGAEWIWVRRWVGDVRAGVPSWYEAPTAGELRQIFGEIETERRGFLANLSEPDLARELAYVNVKGEPRSYPLGDTLLHAVNHSTYHRGQAVTQLRQSGATPPATDFLVFLDAP